MTAAGARQVLVILAVAGGVLAPLAGSPFRTAGGHVDVSELAAMAARGEDGVGPLTLAGWIRERRTDLRVIDLTPGPDEHIIIPGSEAIAIDSLAGAGFGPDDTVVFYADDARLTGEAWVLARALGVRRAYVLTRGLDGWITDVLSPTLARDASPEESSAFEAVADLSRYFGGVPGIGDVTTGAGRAPLDEATPSAPPDRRRGC